MSEKVFDVDTLYEDADRTIALVIVKGIGARVRNLRSTMEYQVVSGHGCFFRKFPNTGQLFDKKVGPGDVVHIPAGTEYQDSGDLVMLVTSTPPFDRSYVEVVG